MAPISGALWIQASGQPYRVPFDGRRALAGEADSADPIVFHLPASARLEEAFVDRYASGGGEARPCAIAGDWVAGSMTRARSDDELKRVGEPGLAGAIPAQPILAASAACGGRNAAPMTVHAHAPNTPLLAALARLSGSVDVRFNLDAASIPSDFAIESSSHNVFDAPSLAAAKASIFRTTIVACRPIRETNVFRVIFRR